MYINKQLELIKAQYSNEISTHLVIRFLETVEPLHEQ